MKRTLCFLLILSGLLGLSGCGQQEAASEQFFAMDTVMQLSAYGKNRNTAVEQAKQTVTALEARLSRTQADSEVSQINANAGQAVRVSEDTAALVRAADTYGAATGGAFDITIAPVVSAWGFTTDHFQVPDPDALTALLEQVDGSQVRTGSDADGAPTVTIGPNQAIDLGGIAKGYASDRVESLFRSLEIPSGLVYLGGNVYAHGSKPDGSAWRVAVQDPASPDAYAAVLSLQDAYAVTSGGYQRYFEQDGKTYHHIIDPATGYPAQSGLTSVTVVADANGEGLGTAAGHGTLCDALSTALFVMGEEKALEFWRTSDLDFDLVLVTDDGRVVLTEGLAAQYEEVEGSGYTYELAD